jgi:hypothetical protein
MDRSFLWYHVTGDGTADVFEDTPEVRAIIDARLDGDLWFGSPEGAIIHGGVIASAFKRKVEATYDAMTWLKTGEHVPTGEIVTITITASREA